MRSSITSRVLLGSSLLLGAAFAATTLYYLHQHYSSNMRKKKRQQLMEQLLEPLSQLADVERDLEGRQVHLVQDQDGWQQVQGKIIHSNILS